MQAAAGWLVCPGHKGTARAEARRGEVHGKRSQQPRSACTCFWLPLSLLLASSLGPATGDYSSRRLLAAALLLQLSKTAAFLPSYASIRHV